VVPKRRRDLFVVGVQVHRRVVASEAGIHTAEECTNRFALLLVMIDIEATNHPFLSFKKGEIN